MHSHSMACLPSYSTVTPPHLLIAVGPSVQELEMATSCSKLLEFSGFFHCSVQIQLDCMDEDTRLQLLGSHTYPREPWFPPIPPHVPATWHLPGMASCLISLAVKNQRIWHHVLGGSLSRQHFCKCEGPVCVYTNNLVMKPLVSGDTQIDLFVSFFLPSPSEPRGSWRLVLILPDPGSPGSFLGSSLQLLSPSAPSPCWASQEAPEGGA